jgi:hypothetical protein
VYLGHPTDTDYIDAIADAMGANGHLPEAVLLSFHTMDDPDTASNHPRKPRGLLDNAKADSPTLVKSSAGSKESPSSSSSKASSDDDSSSSEEDSGDESSSDTSSVSSNGSAAETQEELKDNASVASL